MIFGSGEGNKEPLWGKPLDFGLGEGNKEPLCGKPSNFGLEEGNKGPLHGTPLDFGLREGNEAPQDGISPNSSAISVEEESGKIITTQSPFSEGETVDFIGNPFRWEFNETVDRPVLSTSVIRTVSLVCE